MTTLRRLRAAGILSTIVVFLLALADMFLQLELVDVILTPQFMLPLFAASYFLAPFVMRLIGDKEALSDDEN